MTRQEEMMGIQQQQHPAQIQEAYIQYTVRIRKGSLAAQRLLQHTQRFNSRYEAGWLATLIEEFYVLLDGPDPRGSLLYPLLYHRFEPSRQPSILSAPLQAVVNEEIHEEERDAGIDLTDVEDMSKNLQGYFDVAAYHLASDATEKTGSVS